MEPDAEPDREADGDAGAEIVVACPTVAFPLRSLFAAPALVAARTAATAGTWIPLPDTPESCSPVAPLSWIGPAAFNSPEDAPVAPAGTRSVPARTAAPIPVMARPAPLPAPIPALFPSRGPTAAGNPELPWVPFGPAALAAPPFWTGSPPVWPGVPAPDSAGLAACCPSLREAAFFCAALFSGADPPRPSAAGASCSGAIRSLSDTPCGFTARPGAFAARTARVPPPSKSAVPLAP